MAKALILSLLVIFVLVVLHSKQAETFEDEENEDEEYILDSAVFTNDNVIRRSRFLASAVKKIKKGTACDAKPNRNVCNGLSANNGTSLLYCCKKHCRNVLGDRNNCRTCGHKCRLNERCCGGVCTDVWQNKVHCGKCKKKCGEGVKCEFGYCGYA